MENHFNVNTPAALYVQHFNVALSNFDTHVKEERRFKRLRKTRTKK